MTKFEESYNSKLMSAEEAVLSQIKSGDKIFLGGLGIALVSTSKGVMTDKEARKNEVGGEVLA